MKCPGCGNEVQQHDTYVLYGMRGDKIEILASGEFSIAFCCGVAIMTEKPKEQAVIETQPQSIILPA